MGCTGSKNRGGAANFRPKDSFGGNFLAKHGKRVVKKAKDRTGKEVDKATHDEPMTFEELLHGMKNAKKDKLGR